MPGNATTLAMICGRVGRSPSAAQASRMVKKTCDLHDQRGEPDRHPEPDREEQQPELADADQQAVEDDDRGEVALRRPDEEHGRERREGEAQRRQQERRRVRQRRI